MTGHEGEDPDLLTVREDPDDPRGWSHEYALPSVVFHGHRVPLSFYGIVPGPTGIDPTGFAPGGLL